MEVGRTPPGGGVGLVSLVSRGLLEQLVDEEELHVYRPGCSASWLGPKILAGSLPQGLLSAVLLSFRPRVSKTRTLFMLMNLIFTPAL